MSIFQDKAVRNKIVLLVLVLGLVSGVVLSGCDNLLGTNGDSDTNDTNDTNDPDDTSGSGYSIGDTGPAGGVIFYVDEPDDHSWTYLEAWTEDEGAYYWKTSDTTTSGTLAATGNGYANTYTAMDGSFHPAAEVVRNADHGGKTDWFLPSKAELSLLYEEHTAVGNFESAGYWTSTADRSSFAWLVSFNNGNPVDGITKTTNVRVRAIRAF